MHPNPGPPQQPHPSQLPYGVQPPAPYGVTPPAPYGMQPTPSYDPFAYDKFFVNQKLMSLNSKYYVFNEQGHQLFYVDRPAFKLRAHVGIYTDDTKRQKVLDLRQDSAWAVINLSFTLLDMHGQTIALFKRQGWMSIIRRTWSIQDAHGREMAQAQEDSLWKALFRRIPYLEIIGDFFRTNFDITRQGTKVGEFVRRLTFGDKYVLDLSRDPQRQFDRRVAVALAILLDTAESR
jgi:uncharacterized protein YxjI